MSSVGLQIRLLPYRLGTLLDSFYTFFTLPLTLTLKSRFVRSILTLLVPKVHSPGINARLNERLAINKTLPEIKPAPIPKNLQSKVSIVEHLPSTLSSTKGWHGWWIFPKENEQLGSSPSSTFTIYFPGGAYINSIQPNHFINLYDLSSRTNAIILVIQYPLPPISDDVNVLDELTSLVKQVKGGGDIPSFPSEVKKALKTCGDRFALMGDSAGGGLAFCLGLHLADRVKEESIQPNEVIGIAPWLDLTGSHKELKSIKDPWLSPKLLKPAASAWLGLPSKSASLDSIPSEMLDPFASPFHATAAQLRAFNPRTRLTTIAGTHDLLYPENRDFAARLAKELNGKEKSVEHLDRLGSFETDRVAFRVWESMVHVFTLIPIPFKEREEAREFLARRLIGN